MSGALVLALAYPDITADLAVLSESITARINSLPSAAQPAFTSLLVALTLLSVFFFGLLLDVIGSLYVILELRIFRIHLERNRAWLNKFVDSRFQEYAREDYANILSVVSADSISKSFFRGFLWWKRSTWEEMFKSLRSYLVLTAF